MGVMAGASFRGRERGSGVGSAEEGLHKGRQQLVLFRMRRFEGWLAFYMYVLVRVIAVRTRPYNCHCNTWPLSVACMGGMGSTRHPCRQGAPR